MSADTSESIAEFAIAIDGAEIDQATAEDVIRIEVCEEVGRLARASVVLRNWDPEADPAGDAPTAKLEAGRAIKIRLGYDSKLDEVFDGIVVAAVVQVRRGDLPRLELRCRCRGIGLLGSARYRVWADQSDQTAVDSICSEVGLKADGSSAFVNPFLVQHRVSDWTFVLARAAALGVQAYVRGSTLNFKPAATGSPAATLLWGDNLVEFELAQDISSAFGDCEGTAWDPESKQPLSVTTAASAARGPAGSRPSRTKLLATEKLDGARKRRVAECVAMDQAELEAWTQALVDRGATDSYHGSASCAGDAQLRIDSILEIKGLGSSFDGPHYITRVSHRFTVQGFETQVGLGTPPTPTPEARAGSARVMPPIDSIVIATVESFEDNERSQCRVQIRFPWMDAEEPPVWARLATPSSGGGRGFVFVPEPDDEVLVQFLDGDPRHPVVVGSLWNGVDAPPEQYDAEKNDRRTIVSRSGHAITFDDGDDGPGVLVQTAAGQVLHLDDTSGSEQIRLEDKTGNQLTMDSGGIALTAASGKSIKLSASGGSVEITANEVSASADSNVSLKGNATASLEGSAKAEVKGAQVSLSGDAMVTAKAPMIQLN
ncbi:phage baseplate assembly protein V [Engelhardtia mirabilis]|uniref:Phage late control gene D protein (GPD) n=1 Tax=Engelhardtia mirabilis TaxID=2528011 RepID=A0A518BPM5_9BACT|nr:Phage late control gene D protein (GPD) [Planctomycetes bacterium Pla133]QDV03261.1 Phage late control gene D protein (GPD) [Planctomycetes bacterium Pla86]